MLAMPAFLTAELTAFTAVCMLLSSWLRSPVADGTLRCSASTNLVSVMQSESKIVFFDAIATARATKTPRGKLDGRRADMRPGRYAVTARKAREGLRPDGYRRGRLYKIRRPLLRSARRRSAGVIATAKAGISF